MLSGIYTIKVPKLIPGEEFTNLNLLKKLLQTKNEENVNKIEVLSELENENNENEIEENIENWEMEQECPEADGNEFDNGKNIRG